jgi:hypothetical protein
MNADPNREHRLSVSSVHYCSTCTQAANTVSRKERSDQKTPIVSCVLCALCGYACIQLRRRGAGKFGVSPAFFGASDLRVDPPVLRLGFCRFFGVWTFGV